MSYQPKRLLALLPLSTLLFASCIRDEAPNAECDITGLEQTWLDENKGLIVGEPIVTNDRVSITLEKGTPRTSLAPRFTLTDGAWLSMTDENGATVEANGKTRDFTKPKIYTTHSEDGKWTKEYTVSFGFPKALSTLSFEYFDLDPTGRYYRWYEMDSEDASNPRRDYWASGNAGYALAGMAHSPADYPTTVDAIGQRGNCVKLSTCATGDFGARTHMPIAAGNIFVGEFVSAQAALFPRKATKFGLQALGGTPVRLEGYYKYKAGPTYTDKNGAVVAGGHDKADIYAVVYEVDLTPGAKFTPLNGDNVLTSDRIVMMARIDNPQEAEGTVSDGVSAESLARAAEWVHFSEPFRLMDGKTFNTEILEQNGYAITVVCTSSREGATFEGAVGSTLFVDELQIIYEDQ